MVIKGMAEDVLLSGHESARTYSEPVKRQLLFNIVSSLGKSITAFLVQAVRGQCIRCRIKNWVNDRCREYCFHQ